MIAYDYPLLGLFWTIFIVFLWFAWIMLVFRVFADIFRSDDLSGWSKALWSLFVLVVPLIGVLVYLIARGDSMAKRDIDRAQASEAALRDYIRATADSGGGISAAGELSKLAELHAAGVLTDEEFAQQKAKLLA